jgi:hypothetical protein
MRSPGTSRGQVFLKTILLPTNSIPLAAAKRSLVRPARLSQQPNRLLLPVRRPNCQYRFQTQPCPALPPSGRGP